MLRLATWNVNSLAARAEHVTRFLAERAPDILCVQEVKGTAIPQAFEGYTVALVGQKAYNGVAVLSRVPMTVMAERLPGDDGDAQARYLEVDAGGMRILNIYAPNGNPVGTDKFAYKLAWLERLRARAAELRAARTPFAILGDFNIIPEPADCHDPAAWADDALFQPESRAAFRALAHLGLTDPLAGTAGHYTFWGYRGGAWPANKGVRIDHALLSPSLADGLRACEVDTGPRGWERPSDHTPLLVEVEI
jgi:exodeoxyribonuclease III